MKNNFIEVTHATEDRGKVLINLLNVSKIVKAEDDDLTIIFFNFNRDSKTNLVTVTETYEEIKAMIEAQ